MLGPAKPHRLDEPITVSLEELVPTHHFSRHSEARIDLGFARDWTRELLEERRLDPRCPSHRGYRRTLGLTPSPKAMPEHASHCDEVLESSRPGKNFGPSPRH